MTWFKTLKPDDKVYLRSRWGSGGRSATVAKAGRTWVILNDGTRISLETGRVEDSSYELWQSFEAYEADLMRRHRWREVERLISKIANGASPDHTNGVIAASELLEQVEQLLCLTPKKS